MGATIRKSTQKIDEAIVEQRTARWIDHCFTASQSKMTAQMPNKAKPKR